MPTTFAALQLCAPIQRALDDIGYEQPTPIQEQAIPPARDGRDVFGCAQTGTGKTAAFVLPILHGLAQDNDRRTSRERPIRSLIVTPTRELAAQIGDNIKEYSAHLPQRYAVVFGGVGQGAQVNALRKGVDILVACPGRLLDLINQGHVDLRHLSSFVLDEADRMLDMGFIHDVRKIITHLPKKRQTLFFPLRFPKKFARLPMACCIKRLRLR